MVRHLILLMMLGSGCSKTPSGSQASPHESKSAQAQATPTVPTQTTPTQSENVGTDVPVFTELPSTSAMKIAKPTAWSNDKNQPTLFLFSASWCAGCVATALPEREIVKKYRDRINVGIALAEPEADFIGSKLSYVFADVPVWTMDSVKELAKQCGNSLLPYSCLVVQNKVIWQGFPGIAPAVVDAYLRGELNAFLRQQEADETRIESLLESPTLTPQNIQAIVQASHANPDRQNGIAWGLANRENIPEDKLKLAIALAVDAVRTDGGTDFAQLDTLAVALHKAGRVNDARDVALRVLDLCRVMGDEHCSDEKARAFRYIGDAINALPKD